MNCVLFAKMDQVSSKENKTLKKYWNIEKKNAGKVREFCQSGKVGTMWLGGSYQSGKVGTMSGGVVCEGCAWQGACVAEECAWRGGHVWQRGHALQGGHAWQEGMCVWGGACVAWGMTDRQV